MNGTFTAIIAGGMVLAFTGLMQIDTLLIVFIVGGAAKIIGNIA